MRLITLFYCPLFYIGLFFHITSKRPLILVLASKYSTYFLLAICFPPYTK